MFLSAYHFAGDPAALAAAHDRLYQQIPPESVDLHVCVLAADGITASWAVIARPPFIDITKRRPYEKWRLLRSPRPSYGIQSCVHYTIGVS